MPYLIDGHNLIGKLPDLSLDDPHDEAKLVERLRRYMAHTGKRCTVVFDGGLPGGPSRDLSTYSVRVVFAHGGTDADAIILERIHRTRDTTRLIVVSADRAIVDVTRQKRMRVITPEAFAGELHAAPLPRVAPDDDDDAKPPAHLSAREVDEWLRLFGADSDKD